MITINRVFHSLTAGKILLAAVALLLFGGPMAMDLPGVIAGPNERGTPVLRVGTVLATPAPTSDRVTVLLQDGGEPVPLPYLTPYVPVPGDQVSVLYVSGSGNAMSGLVLGGRAGQAGNLVPNSAFLRHAQAQVGVNRPPYLWAHHHASGQLAFVSGTFSGILQRHALTVAINNGVTGDNYVYSSAIPVTPGETLYVDSTADALCFAPNPTSLTTRLIVAWFTDAETPWPDQLSATQAASTVTDFAGGDGFWLTGSVVPPSTARFARVAIRATQSGGDLSYTLRVTNVEMTRNT